MFHLFSLPDVNETITARTAGRLQEITQAFIALLVTSVSAYLVVTTNDVPEVWAIVNAAIIFFYFGRGAGTTLRN